MTGDPLTILVDHRERGSGVPEALQKLGLSTEVLALEVGDYIVAEGVGAERKTVPDLHRCIANRRLWRQVASLRVDLERAYLVVEGNDLDRGMISRAGVRSALLATIELGVAVVRSRDPRDTAFWLARMAACHQRGKPRHVARSLPHGHAPTPENLLASLPGMSAASARGLLGSFGSIGAVAAATRAELMSVPGIGGRRADTILALLSSETRPS